MNLTKLKILVSLKQNVKGNFSLGNNKFDKYERVNNFDSSQNINLNETMEFSSESSNEN